MARDDGYDNGLSEGHLSTYTMAFLMIEERIGIRIEIGMGSERTWRSKCIATGYDMCWQSDFFRTCGM